jgi:FkbM family methyltransferase
LTPRFSSAQTLSVSESMNERDRDVVDPLDIVVYHIGGEGDYGPATTVLNRYPANSRLVVFEARDDAPDFRIQDDDGLNRRKLIVNRCISGKSGPAKFYINKFALSSSMLPPSPRAIDEHPAYGHCVTWGDNTALDREVTLETITLDDFLKSEQAPAPDILSMDAQGAEYEIMRAAPQVFRSILGVVSEVEFSEVYLGQGLFHEQFGLLLQHGIRLADVLNVQYWHPDIAIGDGFLTVGEALWLRTLDSLPENEPATTRFRRLLKLGAISLAFGRKSLGYKIADRLLKQFRLQLTELGDHPFWRGLSDLHSYVETHRENYLKNTEYFLRADPGVTLRRPGETNIDGRPRTADPPPPAIQLRIIQRPR